MKQLPSKETSDEATCAKGAGAGWIDRILCHPFASTVLMVSVLILVAVTSYMPLKNNQFITLDDPAYITDNSLLQTGLSWDLSKESFRLESEQLSPYWHGVLLPGYHWRWIMN